MCRRVFIIRQALTDSADILKSANHELARKRYRGELDLLQRVEEPETRQDLEYAGVSKSFLILHRKSEVFEKAECGMECLRVVGVL